jgi:hypothetical protein
MKRTSIMSFAVGLAMTAGTMAATAAMADDYTSARVQVDCGSSAGFGVYDGAHRYQTNGWSGRGYRYHQGDMGGAHFANDWNRGGSPKDWDRGRGQDSANHWNRGGRGNSDPDPHRGGRDPGNRGYQGGNGHDRNGDRWDGNADGDRGHSR